MGRLLSWNIISKNKTNSRIPVKIGNNSSYAEEPEITVNINGTKQIQITQNIVSMYSKKTKKTVTLHLHQ